MNQWPVVLFKEESMREGMQIEDTNIPVDDKVRLLHALGETGLQHIVVGSFVSPLYTPQMARIEEIMSKFQPKPGIKYTALLPNEIAMERAKPFIPPLTIDQPRPNLSHHLCDIFTRRNWNRSQAQEIERWPSIVAKAQEDKATEVSIGLGAAWGSNFVGEFSLEQRIAGLEKAHSFWDEVNIKVTSVSLADPMSWTMPHKIEETILAIKKHWPEINNFSLHLHNGRGMALVSAYAALRVLDSTDTLELDGSLGAIGGCPYCGNGRATGMMPTEDFLHMLEDMGIDTGVDLDRIIDCVWMLEEVLGRITLGHVAKVGPLPKKREQWYDPNMPFVETFEQVKHFRIGPDAYQGGISPWREPIRSEQRPETLTL